MTKYTLTAPSGNSMVVKEKDLAYYIDKGYTLHSEEKVTDTSVMAETPIVTVTSRKKEVDDMLSKLERERAKRDLNAGVTFEQMLDYCELANISRGKANIWCCRNKWKTWKVEISHRNKEELKKMVRALFNEKLGNTAR